MALKLKGVIRPQKGPFGPRIHTKPSRSIHRAVKAFEAQLRRRGLIVVVGGRPRIRRKRKRS